MTTILLGGIQLDDADFTWPLYSGGLIRTVEIGFDAARIEEFKALPYITSIVITCSGEDGTVNPSMETLTIEGVRVVEVREVNDIAGVVILGDVRVDLARRVWPSDYMLRWKDGYLQDTNFPTLKGAIEYAALAVPELKAALAEDAFAKLPETDDFTLPDGVLKSGQLCLPALDQLAQTVGASLVVGADGKLRFPANDAQDAFATGSYSWVDAQYPTWDIKSRYKRGLPKTFRVYYNERHAIRATKADSRSTISSNALTIVVENVYFFDGRYGLITDLLEFFGFGRSSLTEEQIAKHYTGNNFEGTVIERNGDAEVDDIIAIIKRDWRQLYRVAFYDSRGRRGGWSEMVFGKFRETTDKDGATRYAVDPEAAPVQANWTQWMAVMEAQSSTVEGAVVARSYRNVDRFTDAIPPSAPFAASWVSEPDGVFRVSYNGKADNAQAAWIGLMDLGSDVTTELVVEYSSAEDDKGNHVETEFGLYIPEISDLKFKRDYDMYVYLVATRRLPNDQSRWSYVDVEGFADGDVEVQEIEVGEELFAIRDYVDGDAKPAEPDGLGNLLNSVEIEKDAQRRIRILKDEMAARLEGVGTAQGIAPVADTIYPQGPVAEMNIIVDDSTVVFTEIVMANRDSAGARWNRKRVREQSRKRDVGGVPVV